MTNGTMPIPGNPSRLPHQGPLTVRESRDAAVMRLAFDERIIEQGKIAKRLAEMGFGTIGATRVGQILRAHSGRDQVLRLLEEDPDRRWSSREIATQLGLDINKVQYVADSLCRKGLAVFDVSTGDNGHRILDNIVLSKRAKRALATRPPTAPNGSGRPIKVFDARGDAQTDRPTVEAWQAAESARMEELMVVAGPRVDTDGELHLRPSEIPQFPLINRLVERDRELAEASRILERQGLEELALAVMAMAEVYTPLEREVVAFVRAHEAPWPGATTGDLLLMPRGMGLSKVDTDP